MSFLGFTWWCKIIRDILAKLCCEKGDCMVVFIKLYYNNSTIFIDGILKTMDHTDQVHLENIVNKETYTKEEKQFILGRLNKERLERQKFEQKYAKHKKNYTDEEKHHILQELNEKRIRDEHHKKMKRIRFLNKKIYTFANKTYYKFKEMEREYFLEIDICKKFSSRPCIVPLYYRTFGEMKKRDVLLKIEPHSDKIFISKDAIRVYFKPYALQEKTDQGT